MNPVSQSLSETAPPCAANVIGQPCVVEDSSNISRSKRRRLRDRRVAVRHAMIHTNSIKSHVASFCPFVDNASPDVHINSSNIIRLEAKVDFILQHLGYGAPSMDCVADTWKDEGCVWPTLGVWEPLSEIVNRTVDGDVCQISGHWEAIAAPSNQGENNMSESDLTIKPCFAENDTTLISQRRGYREEQHADSLGEAPIVSASDCSVKQIYFGMRVYTGEGVQIRDLDEKSYVRHLQNGELDVMPPWMQTIMSAGPDMPDKDDSWSS